jgi:hypothetical protein
MRQNVVENFFSYQYHDHRSYISIHNRIFLDNPDRGNLETAHVCAFEAAMLPSRPEIEVTSFLSKVIRTHVRVLGNDFYP